MSQKADAVKAIYDSFGKADIPAILARFSPDVAWEHDRGGDKLAVTVRRELVCKSIGKRVRELGIHLRTLGTDGLVTGFRHFVDTHQWAQATRT